MASRESQGSKKDEDPYDIDYYERTGGNEAGIQRQKIEDIQREIWNVEVKLNNMSKHSLIRFICLLVLGLAILILLTVMFVSRGGGETAGAKTPEASSEPPTAPTPASSCGESAATGAPSTATTAIGRYKYCDLEIGLLFLSLQLSFFMQLSFRYMTKIVIFIQFWSDFDI